MNAPSSTIKAAGGIGAIVALCFIALAVISPDAYKAMPPGASETVIVALSTLGGYFKKEKVITVAKAVAKKVKKKK